MGAFLSLPRDLLNLLLPFTDKSTPLVQDLVHTAILCGTLYFAPQLVDLYHSHNNANQPSNGDPSIPDTTGGTPADEPPIDENLILQPSEDDDIEPPPLAPTPPPGREAAGPANWEHHLHQDAAAAAFPAEPQPRPADDRPRPTPQNRAISTKKAKSLARKDERRAYYEFLRQEGELRRLREAEGKEEREAALEEERARRLEVERAIEERNRAERQAKKEQERLEQEEERLKRDTAVRNVRERLEEKGAVDLVDTAWEQGKDLVWIERLVRASGLLAQMSKDGVHTMITGSGWAVRLDARTMHKAYADAVEFGNTKDGKVSFEDFGGILEQAVRARATG